MSTIDIIRRENLRKGDLSILQIKEYDKKCLFKFVKENYNSNEDINRRIEEIDTNLDKINRILSDGKHKNIFLNSNLIKTETLLTEFIDSDQVEREKIMRERIKKLTVANKETLNPFYMKYINIKSKLEQYLKENRNFKRRSLKHAINLEKYRIKNKNKFNNGNPHENAMIKNESNKSINNSQNKNSKNLFHEQNQASNMKNGFIHFSQYEILNQNDKIFLETKSNNKSKTYKDLNYYNLSDTKKIEEMDNFMKDLNKYLNHEKYIHYDNRSAEKIKINKIKNFNKSSNLSLKNNYIEEQRYEIKNENIKVFNRNYTLDNSASWNIKKLKNLESNMFPKSTRDLFKKGMLDFTHSFEIIAFNHTGNEKPSNIGLKEKYRINNLSNKEINLYCDDNK